MLQRVMIDGIELPRLYIAEDQKDVELAKNNGIPYVRWTQGQEALIKILLRPVLERLFPYIKWNKVLGPRSKFKTQVEICERLETGPDQIELHERLSAEGDVPTKSFDLDIDETSVDVEPEAIEMDGDTIVEHSVACDEERVFSGGSEMKVQQKLDLYDYVGDMSSYVNIDMLQRLSLMPAFLGNILECIKLNITSGIYWTEGYNKRRGLPIGRYNSSAQLPNLIILDVSGSIPRGISATMIALIDTLRSQLSADLIITSTNSRFYPMGSELPDPQRIRNMFGFGNECYDFFCILSKHIKGRHYGHVFSFGDNDSPAYYNFNSRVCPELPGTTVEHVHHYHTGKYLYGDKHNVKTGYAEWCHMLAKKPMEEYDMEWCSVIES